MPGRVRNETHGMILTGPGRQGVQERRCPRDHARRELAGVGHGPVLNETPGVKPRDQQGIALHGVQPGQRRFAEKRHKGQDKQRDSAAPRPRTAGGRHGVSRAKGAVSPGQGHLHGRINSRGSPTSWTLWPDRACSPKKWNRVPGTRTGWPVPRYAGPRSPTRWDRCSRR